MRLALAAFLVLSGASARADRPITVTFLHTNDLHAHLEPTLVRGKPYGGYARIATLVKGFQASDPNPVFLNAGDVFQGTLYFNVYEGLADLAILNAMGTQAMTAGNHEFDRQTGPLATFARNANFPILGANVQVADGDPLKELVRPSAVLDVAGEKIGIVGATTDDLLSIAVTGPTVSLRPLVPTIQAEVDRLTAEGVSKIVLLSHCGYDEDKRLAAALRNVDLIIGGHSHSPLGTPSLPGWPRSAGPYPTSVKDATGREVPIFQAWEWGKVLGRFKADFDEKGQLVRVYEASPILVDETVPEDPTVRSMVEAYKRPIAALQNEVVGEAGAELSRGGAMGLVLADSMLAATQGQGAVAAFANAGGVRSGIDAGPITYGEAISVAPFSNTLVLLDLTGAELLAALKLGTEGGGRLIPSREFAYRKEGDQITATLDGKPIVPTQTYRLAFNSFIAQGGDGQTTIRDAKGERRDTGIVDVDALVAYLRANRPVAPPTEGRTGR